VYSYWIRFGDKCDDTVAYRASMGVCRGGWWTSPLPEVTKAGNGFLDWDKLIVSDGSTSESFHAKVTSELTLSPGADSR